MVSSEHELELSFIIMIELPELAIFEPRRLVLNLMVLRKLLPALAINLDASTIGIHRSAHLRQSCSFELPEGRYQIEERVKCRNKGVKTRSLEPAHHWMLIFSK